METDAYMETDEAPSTSKAAALLEGTEASADKRWAELSDQALDEDIAAYRGGIEDVSKELEALGVIVSLEERTDGDGAGIAGMEVQRVPPEYRDRARSLREISKAFPAHWLHVPDFHTSPKADGMNTQGGRICLDNMSMLMYRGRRASTSRWAM